MIEEYIPFGYKNRLSRGYLNEILHMTDRKIREAIADAGERGILIISADCGYFRPVLGEDDNYVYDYIAKEDSRARKERAKVNRLRQQAKIWKGVSDKKEKVQITGQMYFTMADDGGLVCQTEL